MALNLTKTSPAINLTKSAKHLLTGLDFGLSWDGNYDLDASAIVLKEGSLLTGDIKGSLVGFPMLSDGVYLWEVKGVTYSGDARDGAADGFDETLGINLSEVEGDEIILYISSWSALAPTTFGATENPTATLCSTDGKELAKVCLSSDAAFGTAFKMVRVYKDGSEWKVENVSELVGSSANGLADIVESYK